MMNYQQQRQKLRTANLITKMKTEKVPKENIERINEIIKNNVIEMEQTPERDHDFFYRDDANKTTMAKHLKRRIKPYTSTRFKARNFLSSIAYSGVKTEVLLTIILFLT